MGNKLIGTSLTILVAVTISCRFGASIPPGVDFTTPAMDSCPRLTVASITTLVDPGRNVDWSTDGFGSPTMRPIPRIGRIVPTYIENYGSRS